MWECSKLILVLSSLTLITACSRDHGQPSGGTPPQVASQNKQALTGTLEMKRTPKPSFGAWTDITLKMPSPVDNNKEVSLYRTQYGGVPSTEFSLYQGKSTELNPIEASMQCVEGHDDICDLAIVNMKIKLTAPKAETRHYMLYFQTAQKDAREQQPLVLKFKYVVSILNPGGVQAAILNIPFLRDQKRLD